MFTVVPFILQPESMDRILVKCHRDERSSYIENEGGKGARCTPWVEEAWKELGSLNQLQKSFPMYSIFRRICDTSARMRSSFMTARLRLPISSGCHSRTRCFILFKNESLRSPQNAKNSGASLADPCQQVDKNQHGNRGFRRSSPESFSFSTCGSIVHEPRN